MSANRLALLLAPLLTGALFAGGVVVAGCTLRPTTPVGRDAEVGFDAGGPDAGPMIDAGPREDGGPPIDDVLIYAHSDNTLYTFSPYTLRVSEIGLFHFSDGSPAPNMLDLAVNADGDVYTCSNDTLFRADPETAVVTEVARFDFTGGERLYALTFLYQGAYSLTSETLVGATNEGAYYQVDPNNARTVYLGQYPEGWRSSGDLVSVEALSTTYATLKRDDFSSDMLARIDFDRSGGSSVHVIGPIRSATEEFVQLFGLGYWGRSLYGFSNAGQLIEINRETGAAEVVTADTGAERFWGAGVTTQAPVLF